MDFGRFLENLPKDNKTLLLSLAMIFPMAYIDCWKLSPSFAELEILKQVFLAAGISVLLLMAGNVLNVGYLKFSGYGKYISDLSLTVIVTPTAFATGGVVVFGIHHPLSFFYNVVAIIVASFGMALFSRPSIEREANKIAKKEKEEEKTSNSSRKSNQDSTTDNQ